MDAIAVAQEHSAVHAIARQQLEESMRLMLEHYPHLAPQMRREFFVDFLQGYFCLDLELVERFTGEKSMFGGSAAIARKRIA